MSHLPLQRKRSPASFTERWSTLAGYARLGLSGNPFRVLTDAELAASFTTLPGRSEPDPARLADDACKLVEVTADEGQGKTTFLLALRAEYQRRGTAVQYHYLPPDRSDSFPSLDFPASYELDESERPGEHRDHPSPPDRCHILLLDEMQRTTWRERRRLHQWLLMPGNQLVTGTHRPWRPRGVPRREIRLPLPQPGDVVRFFEVRIDAARRGGTPCTFQLDEAAVELLCRRGRSLRRIEQTLYEVFRELAESRSPPPKQVIVERQVKRAMAKAARATTVRGPASRRRLVRLAGLFSRRDR